MWGPVQGWPLEREPVAEQAMPRQGEVSRAPAVESEKGLRREREPQEPQHHCLQRSAKPHLQQPNRRQQNEFP